MNDQTQATSSLSSRLNTLFEPWNRMTGPGAVVGVAQHGRTLFRAAFGMANVEHRVPMRIDTRVSLCSVTKHMTCAAVLMLADEGRLKLDDPIGHWLPELSPAMQSPTLHQLMNHTGGVRCHLDTAAFNGVTPHPFGQPMRTLLRQTSVNFAPGADQMYCNGGYVLLSLAIERAAGVPFEQYLKKALFDPLRMDNSSAPRSWWPLPTDMATHYLPLPNGQWRHGIPFEEEMLGAGSAISTVDDMLRWAQHLRVSDGPVSVSTLTTDDPVDGLGPVDVYRHGVTDQVWRGVRLIEHSGGAVGASSHMLIAPEHALDIFVFFNGMEPAQKVARQIASIVLEHVLLPEEASTITAAQAYAPLLGTFLDEEQGLVMGFADVDGVLGVSMLGGPAVPMLQAHTPQNGELPFELPLATGSMLWRFDPQSNRLEWGHGRFWHPLHPIRLDSDAHTAVEAALKDAVFFSEEAHAHLRFGVQEGALRMFSFGDFGRWTFPVQVLTNDMFAFGFYQGSAGWLARIRREEGRVCALEMSSTRTRGLVFKRELASQ